VLHLTLEDAITYIPFATFTRTVQEGLCISWIRSALLPDGDWTASHVISATYRDRRSMRTQISLVFPNRDRGSAMSAMILVSNFLPLREFETGWEKPPLLYVGSYGRVTPLRPAFAK
jgi:hypothetical protein